LALDLIGVTVARLVPGSYDEVEVPIGGQLRRCERGRARSGRVSWRREVLTARCLRLVNVIDDPLLRRDVVRCRVPTQVVARCPAPSDRSWDTSDHRFEAVEGGWDVVPAPRFGPVRLQPSRAWRPARILVRALLTIGMAGIPRTSLQTSHLGIRPCAGHLKSTPMIARVQLSQLSTAFEMEMKASDCGVSPGIIVTRRRGCSRQGRGSFRGRRGARP
jgi:hypothetical protein